MIPDRNAVAIKDDEIYLTVGILSYGRGLFERPPVRGKDTSYSTYYRLAPRQFVYSKLFAWEGALAVVDKRFAGMFVSQEFPTFTINTALTTPEYLSLLCTWPETWARVRMGETGMGGRRKRVHPDRLLEVQLPFPSLPEQRRIVDLMTTLDLFLVRARDLGFSANQAYQASLEELASSGDRRVSLASVSVLTKAGGTPSRQVPQYFGDEIPWLKSGEVANDRIETAEEAITAEGLAASSAWLVPADSVVVAMYGATAGAVGYLTTPMATNQAVLALRANPTHFDQRFLFHWLRGRSNVMKGRATGAAQPNLSKQRVLEEEVPAVTLDRQREIAGVLDAILDIEREARALTHASDVLRSTLLSDLLSGQHRIHDSYDALLETV